VSKVLSKAATALRIQNYGQPAGEPSPRRAPSVSPATRPKIREGDRKYLPVRSQYEGRMTLAEVRAALDEGRLRLFAQRIEPTEKGRASHGGPSHELLLRLIDPDGKVLPPVDLIATAEHHNLMAEIDRWVLQEALLYCGEEIARTPGFCISINLSAQSLNDMRFLAFFRDLMGLSSLPPHRVTFEITETALIHNLAAAGILLDEVRALGCRIALDDFGVGLSSFHYLKCFKVDYIKIEGSYVQNIATSPVDLAIVRAINQMAHDLGIETIAEFVKDEAVRQRLVELNVDFSQGFGVGMPAPLEELLEVARQEVAMEENAAPLMPRTPRAARPTPATPAGAHADHTPATNTSSPQTAMAASSPRGAASPPASANPPPSPPSPPRTAHG
jgi:EAL domain-containing protein (putative c-di-GMP-specific phosphodiesterase class I)